MEESNRRSSRVQLALPIRVRGMSAKSKFFDEEAATILISQRGFMTKIRNLVELDTEIHVVSLKNDVAGTFRVVWVNTQEQEGFHQLGLEVTDQEGDMWGMHFPAEHPDTDTAMAQAWLDCQRCHQKQLGAVPLAELEHLDVGVLVARHCDKCRATTPWEFSVEGEAPPPAPPEVTHPLREPPRVSAPAPREAASGKKSGADNRTARRAPLKLTVKVERQAYGTTIEDVGETINVSRNGVYFLTSQNYHVGEVIKVTVPHKKGETALPIVARVIRQDQPQGTFDHAVAVQLETPVSFPGLEEKKKLAEQRSRSRVPLKLPIKVTRKKYGGNLDDISQTINISRAGAYFTTSQIYDVGEIVDVVMPYKEGEMAMPVPSRVVRVDLVKGGFTRAVALFMGDLKK